MRAAALLLVLATLAAGEEVTLENATRLIVLAPVQVAWATLTPRLAATDAVDGYQARVVELPDGSEAIYLRQPDGRVHRLENVPLPHRFSTDLLFSDPGRLNLNRWHSPHYGWHYEVDCRTLRVVEVRGFGDLFYVNGR